LRNSTEPKYSEEQSAVSKLNRMLQRSSKQNCQSQSGAQPGGRAFRALSLPEIFKTLHRNFDICRNFQRIKMKFHILIIFKNSYWNFSLSCSLIIISLQDLSWDRLSDRKFRKWLVFNHKYAGTTCWVSNNTVIAIIISHPWLLQTDLYENPLQNLDTKFISCAVFLDLIEVFDSVNHSILLTKREHYGARGNTFKIIQSYLSNRITVRPGGKH